MDAQLGAPDQQIPKLTKLDAWNLLPQETKMGAVRLVKSAIQPIGLEYIRAEILAGDRAIYPNFIERCYQGWTFAVDVMLGGAVHEKLFPPLPYAAQAGNPNALATRSVFIHAIIDVAIMVGIWEHLSHEDQAEIAYQTRYARLRHPNVRMLPSSRP